MSRNRWWQMRRKERSTGENYPNDKERWRFYERAGLRVSMMSEFGFLFFGENPENPVTFAGPYVQLQVYGHI